MVNHVAAGTAAPAMPHIKPLTGLRFVAALLVVLFHFFPAYLMDGSGLPHAASAMFHQFVKNGYTGVSFFFLLSGFILTYSYVDPRGRLRGSRRAFWLGRVARLYPVYLVALVVAAPLFFGSAPGPAGCDPASHPAVTGVTAALLVQSWLPCSASAWNPPGWSLSVEAFFYLLFPFIALAVARLRPRHLIIVVAAAWAILAAIALGYLALAPDGPVQESTWAGYFWLKTVYLHPLARLPEFVIGAALGALFLRQRYGRAPRWRWFSPAACSVLALAGTVAALAMGPFPIILFNGIILVPLFALLIYSLAFSAGPLASFFSSGPLLHLGHASYAIYILHWPTWYWLLRLIDGIDPQFRTSAPYFCAYLALVIALGLASYHWIERPANRAIKRAVAARRTTASPTVDDRPATAA